MIKPTESWGGTRQWKRKSMEPEIRQQAGDAAELLGEGIRRGEALRGKIRNKKRGGADTSFAEQKRGLLERDLTTIPGTDGKENGAGTRGGGRGQFSEREGYSLYAHKSGAYGVYRVKRASGYRGGGHPLGGLNWCAMLDMGHRRGRSILGRNGRTIE